MKIFELDNGYQVICEWKKTRTAFKHVATILKGRSVYETKICYQNRTWESYEYQDVLRKAIYGYFPKDCAETLFAKVDAEAKGESRRAFNPVKMAMAFGAVLTNTPEEKAAWNKRMISTIPGVGFPDDFDTLPVEEQNRRLDAAKEVL